MSYLHKVHKSGVCNIEMESSCFAAMCKRAGIAAAVVCVTLVNRLQGDQVHLEPKDHEEYQIRPMKLIMSHIIKKLSKNSN
jgi:uridine phosphorylase